MRHLQTWLLKTKADKEKQTGAISLYLEQECRTAAMWSLVCVSPLWRTARSYGRRKPWSGNRKRHSVTMSSRLWSQNFEAPPQWWYDRAKRYHWYWVGFSGGTRWRAAPFLPCSSTFCWRWWQMAPLLICRVWNMGDGGGTRNLLPWFAI